MVQPVMALLITIVCGDLSTPLCHISLPLESLGVALLLVLLSELSAVHNQLCGAVVWELIISAILSIVCVQLLDEGADIHAIAPKRANGGSPLAEAVAGKHEALVELLLRYGADPFTENSAGARTQINPEPACRLTFPYK